MDGHWVAKKLAEPVQVKAGRQYAVIVKDGQVSLVETPGGAMAFLLDGVVTSIQIPVM